MDPSRDTSIDPSDTIPRNFENLSASPLSAPVKSDATRASDPYRLEINDTVVHLHFCGAKSLNTCLADAFDTAAL